MGNEETQVEITDAEKIADLSKRNAILHEQIQSMIGGFSFGQSILQFAAKQVVDQKANDEKMRISKFAVELETTIKDGQVVFDRYYIERSGVTEGAIPEEKFKKPEPQVESK